tara:strand:+ start:1733 stop:2581 length:849 start_codon:yes stop_codon:yes gene_type:complete
MLNKRTAQQRNENQLSFDLAEEDRIDLSGMKGPSQNISDFLDFIVDATPKGDVYLFGGLIRDMALSGKKGFNSDVDIVVDGNWTEITRYIEGRGSKKNRFGGYRLWIGEWPVDIWNARETWAVKNGYVKYQGIASLTETTILNWDAVLMNWRKKTFICKDSYLDDLSHGVMNIVLPENPNPTGMAARVFRHLSLKDAQKVTVRTADYLSKCTERYSFMQLREYEIKSYRNSQIEHSIYRFFAHLNKIKHLPLRIRYTAAIDWAEEQGLQLPFKQKKLDFFLE